MRDEFGRRAPARVRRELATGERLVVAQHRHPITLVLPFVAVIGSLLVVYAVSSVTGYIPGVLSVLSLAWLVVLAWAGLRWWEHEVHWFVITDKRVIKIEGIIKTVAMLPLPRLTDILFKRTFWGQIFGYGRFELESAGQIQALRNIEFVPRPDETHKKLTELLYRTPDTPSVNVANTPSVRVVNMPPGTRLNRPAVNRSDTTSLNVINLADGNDDGT